MPNMSLKKNPMPSLDANVRNKNFEEVALGYTEEMAIDEAERCLHRNVCKRSSRSWQCCSSKKMVQIFTKKTRIPQAFYRNVSLYDSSLPQWRI